MWQLVRTFAVLTTALFGIHDDTREASLSQRYHNNPNDQFKELLGKMPFENSVRGRIGGYVDFLCNTTQDATGLLAPCAVDCHNNHGADSGTCGDVSKGDYNCYCDKYNKKLKPDSLHCMVKGKKYQHVCDIDCKCNHAATGGTCHWGKKACVCHNQGANKNNKGCDYKDWYSFAVQIHKNVGSKGFGYVEEFFQKYICPTLTEDYDGCVKLMNEIY